MLSFKSVKTETAWQTPIKNRVPRADGDFFCSVHGDRGECSLPLYLANRINARAGLGALQGMHTHTLTHTHGQIPSILLDFADNYLPSCPRLVKIEMVLTIGKDNLVPPEKYLKYACELSLHGYFSSRYPVFILWIPEHLKSQLRGGGTKSAKSQIRRNFCLEKLWIKLHIPAWGLKPENKGEDTWTKHSSLGRAQGAWKQGTREGEKHNDSETFVGSPPHP